MKKVGGASDPQSKRRRARATLHGSQGLRRRGVWSGAVRRLQGTGAPPHPPPRCPVRGTTGARVPGGTGVSPGEPAGEPQLADQDPRAAFIAE